MRRNDRGKLHHHDHLRSDPSLVLRRLLSPVLVKLRAAKFVRDSLPVVLHTTPNTAGKQPASGCLPPEVFRGLPTPMKLQNQSRSGSTEVRYLNFGLSRLPPKHNHLVASLLLNRSESGR